MARPRIFVSSTYYDLRQVRSDIERSIRELGYEPVLHESGVVPYSSDEPLESGAFREVELSDIIVFITGGQFGSESSEKPGHSISEVELRRALEKGIPMFIFVQKGVLAEYQTYKLNRENDAIQYAAVSDTKVFGFLDELYSLPSNNPIFDFELADDITRVLKAQFAGLFHRFLRDEKRLKEVNMVAEMKSIATTLRELVTFLTDERRSTGDAVKAILRINHPVFRRLQSLTNTPYRVFFTTRAEMQKWLMARRYVRTKSEDLEPGSVEEWSQSKSIEYIKFTRDIFGDDGKLKPFDAADWDDNWIQLDSGVPF